MTVTVALLIYKSQRWLRWCIEQLDAARNVIQYEVLVVGNDATGPVVDAALQLEASGRCRYVDHRNDDANEYAMARVYRAWNRAVVEARTELVVLVNSDMAFADGWIDELVALRARCANAIPTSLLVESGKLRSGLPDYVRDFGRDPRSFDRAAFARYAEELRERPGKGDLPGGLFMPVLWSKESFEKIGGYDIQVPNHVLASDATTFNRAKSMLGLEHRTATRSIVYHVQLGETDDP